MGLEAIPLALLNPLHHGAQPESRLEDYGFALWTNEKHMVSDLG